MNTPEIVALAASGGLAALGAEAAYVLREAMRKGCKLAFTVSLTPPQPPKAEAVEPVRQGVAAEAARAAGMLAPLNRAFPSVPAVSPDTSPASAL